MATSVDMAIEEVVDTLDAIANQHEGLRDYSALALSTETRNAVLKSLEQFDRRVRLLEVARNAMLDLVNDGYPEMPPVEVEGKVLTEIQANASSIQAAVAGFSSSDAVNLGLLGGTATPK